MRHTKHRYELVLSVLLLLLAWGAVQAESVSFTLTLHEELNFVHIPVQDPDIQTIADVYRAFGGAGDVLVLIYYDTGQGGFRSYTEPFNSPTDPVNVPLQPFMGLIAFMAPGTSKQVTFVGTAWPDAPLPLVEGVNLIGLPAGDPRIQSFSDLMELNPSILAVVGQNEAGELKGYPGIDLPIRLGQSFIVVVSSDTTLRLSTAASSIVPLLMVHGLGGRSTNFDTIKRRLVENGYPEEWLFAIDLVPNNTTCDPGHVDQIHDMVESIVQSTGFERIDLLGHSNGGTDNMNYMRYSNGTERIRNWVSIGGANDFACQHVFGPPPEDPTPGDQVLYTSIYSTDDKIVPNEASILEGARNIAVSGVSHVGLLFNEQVFQLILEALQGNGLNDN